MQKPSRNLEDFAPLGCRFRTENRLETVLGVPPQPRTRNVSPASGSLRFWGIFEKHIRERTPSAAGRPPRCQPWVSTATATDGDGGCEPRERIVADTVGPMLGHAQVPDDRNAGRK